MRARISGNARERVEIFGKCIDSSLYDADSARMEAMAHIIVGTAGHIDHGKTSLVKALTGIDADRLKEEKERGITIDIGFASLRLDDETTIGFIDVPGHERFVKNMLAGVGGIDAVMLVIAADESVMPQTREHLDICSLLRVQARPDGADEDRRHRARHRRSRRKWRCRSSSRGSFLAGRAAPPRQLAHRRRASPALTAALRRLALEVAPRDASQIFRLPDRPLLHDERLRHGRVRHADRRTDPQRRRGRGAARAAGRAGARHPGARPQRGRSAGRPADGAEPAARRARRDRARHGPGSAGRLHALRHVRRRGRAPALGTGPHRPPQAGAVPCRHRGSHGLRRAARAGRARARRVGIRPDPSRAGRRSRCLATASSSGSTRR